MVYEEILFTEDECKKIINYKFEYPNHHVTPKWSLIDGTRTVFSSDTTNNKNWIKKYQVWDITNDENTNWFYKKIYDWFENITGINLEITYSTNNLELRKYSHKLHQYNIGDRFDKHIDNMDEYSDRIWNIGIILNSDFEGGEYIWYDSNDNPNEFSKHTGNVVAYKSNVPHEITKITKGSRYSMVIKLHSWELKNKKNITLF